MGAIFDLRGSTTRLRAAESALDPREPSASRPFDALALLLSETAAGRETAFARLYELTATRLFAIARGIVGGRADVAEDVLQDSFVRRLAMGASLRPRQGLGLWLAGAHRPQPGPHGARNASSARGWARRAGE